MKKRLLYGGLVVVLGLNLFFGARIYLSSAVASEKDDTYPNLALFARVLEMVRKDYVDGEKLTYQELIHGSLKGMLNTLDPHSEFMDAPKFDELRKDTEGQFGGVGIVVSVKDNSLTVVSPIEDTPGFRAGIQAGDRIVSIDGKSTDKLSLTDAVKKLRGQTGTQVTLGVLRPPANQIKEYQLTRADIKVDTIKDQDGKRDFPLLEDKTGYVRISQFGEKTGDDLGRALKELKKKGMESLVLDLRDNPGGLLDQAVKVCERFLPNGQLVVSTEGRVASQKAEYKAAGRDPYQHLPIVVLVNGGSASAAEIVAGCLQDLKRAIILGEQSFGKGSVQSILPLQDGSALRLTTAKYYTPSHRVIHEKGITPDMYVSITPEVERDLAVKRTPGALESAEDGERGRLERVRDPQLDRALDVLKGVHLYTRRGRAAERVTVSKLDLPAAPPTKQ